MDQRDSISTIQSIRSLLREIIVCFFLPHFDAVCTNEGFLQFQIPDCCVRARQKWFGIRCFFCLTAFRTLFFVLCAVSLVVCAYSFRNSGSFVQHVAMVVERESQDRSMATAMESGRRTKRRNVFQRLTLTASARKIVLKTRNPQNTPTESCESDGTEYEEVKSFISPLGLLDPLIEEKKIPGSRSGCQIDVTAKAESRFAPEIQTSEEIGQRQKQQRAE